MNDCFARPMWRLRTRPPGYIRTMQSCRRQSSGRPRRRRSVEAIVSGRGRDAGLAAAQLCRAHNPAVRDDSVLVVDEGLATRARQVIGRGRQGAPRDAKAGTSKGSASGL
jgi:hypothetical protein